MTKADPYEHHRDEVAAIIEDEQYLFDSVEEALLLYPPAGENEELEKQLLSDKYLWRLIISVKAKERAQLRRKIVKSAKEGNDKMAKIAMPDLSETEEWARITGKPWGSLGMIGDGKDDGRVEVKMSVETMSDRDLIEAGNELERRKKKARALLADTTATEAHTEETEQDDKIEFEE
jgi:hypothetical protein